MCGIAGLFSKSLEVSEGLGSHLGDMLLQLSDRGPDSAGVAVYRDPAPSGSSKLSLFSPDPAQDWDAVRAASTRRSAPLSPSRAARTR
jgi:amidophosphoribosyltransferase